MIQKGLFDEKKRQATYAEKILVALQDGPKTSVELNEICFRYSARIYELRKKGFEIKKTSDPGSSVFVYELINS